MLIVNIGYIIFVGYEFIFVVFNKAYENRSTIKDFDNFFFFLQQRNSDKNENLLWMEITMSLYVSKYNY